MELAFLCIGNSVLKWFIALLPLDPCVSFSFSFFPLVWALDIFSEDFIFIYSKHWDNVFFLPFFTVSQWKYLIVYTWRKKKNIWTIIYCPFSGLLTNQQSVQQINNLFEHKRWWDALQIYMIKTLIFILMFYILFSLYITLSSISALAWFLLS